MLKTHIIYKGRKPRQRDIDELLALTPLDITWIHYRGKIVANGTTALDWGWLRTLYTQPVDLQCFLVPQKELTDAGIKTHIGLYNLDTDNVHDFYISLSPGLDDRAKANGFNSNLAWIFCHELLHGIMWNKHKTFSMADGEVHAGEKLGKLKDMIATYNNEQAKIAALTQKLTILQRLLASLKRPASQPSDVLPLVKRQGDKVLASMKALGYEMRITQGFRSIAEQNALYAQGRTKPGQIVTNAKGGESFHNYGMSLDVVFRKQGYNVPNTVWETFGIIAEQNGFEWGGRWTTFVDKPHIQLTLGYTLKACQQGKIDYSKFN